MLILPVKTHREKDLFIFIFINSHTNIWFIRAAFAERPHFRVPPSWAAGVTWFLGPTLTSMDVELVPDLPADLGWSDVLLPVQRVHHIQLLLLDQLRDDLDAVPLRQSGRRRR